MKITHEQFQEALKIVKKYQEQINQTKGEISKVSKFLSVTKDTSIWESGLSSNLCSTLSYFKKGGIGPFRVGDISEISLSDFSKWRNIGKKRIEELKELSLYSGVPLKP